MVLLAVAWAGCESPAEKDFKTLVSRMCACEDAACVQAVRDEASATRSLLDLQDPDAFEARFGDDPAMVQALAEWEACAARHGP